MPCLPLFRRLMNGVGHTACTQSCTREDSLVVELPDLDVCLRRTSQQIAAAFGFSLAVGECVLLSCCSSSHKKCENTRRTLEQVWARLDR